MTTFSISPSVSHNVGIKKTKFLTVVNFDCISTACSMPEDYDHVQLIYKYSQEEGLFKATINSSTSVLYWGIIGDEFNDLQ